jgi:hypothetical protein
MSKCPLNIGYQLRRALHFAKRALRQPEPWCMFRSERHRHRRGMDKHCRDVDLPRFRIASALMYLFMVWLTTLSVAETVPGVATTLLRLAPTAYEQ